MEKIICRDQLHANYKLLATEANDVGHFFHLNDLF